MNTRFTRITTDVRFPAERTSTQTSTARVSWCLRRRPMNAPPKVRARV